MWNNYKLASQPTKGAGDEIEAIALYVNIKARSLKRLELKTTVSRLISKKYRYEKIAKKLNIPWALLACIHNTEGAANFKTNIANGQSLGRRTTIVPRGHLWNTWEESVDFVYKQQGWDKVKIWNIPKILYYFEKYNGFGYRKRNRHSQYLVGGSNIERPGRYVADGKWSSTTWSKQIGTALILRELEMKQHILFKGEDCIGRYRNEIDYKKTTIPDIPDIKGDKRLEVLSWAEGEKGQKETPGTRKNNERIVEYWKIGKVALTVSDDQVPWCAGFIAACMESNGVRSTRKANARSYLNWGVKTSKPQKGDIVIFRRGTSSWQGHVAFYLYEKSGRIYHVGGNQNNSVNVSSTSKGSLLGYRTYA